MKPKINDAALLIKMPRALLTELQASTPDMSKKVRALITQWLRKRSHERAKASPQELPE